MAALRTGVKALRPSPFLYTLTRSFHYAFTSMSANRKFVPPQLLDDIEDVEAYRAGGFHPVSIGDYFAQGRYKILHKLGYGGSSTVWLARDGGTQSGRLVTLKVVRADASDIHNPALTIPGILRAANPSCSGIQTVDHHFFVKGPNGSHLVLASRFAGPSILAMSDCPGRVSGSKRLRADLARKVAKQVATAVHYMHSAGVVHGGKVYTFSASTSLSPGHVKI